MQKSLVLIVGAGASKEVNLPVGTELRAQIASALDIKYPDGYQRSGGDGVIDQAFRVLARRENAARPDINQYLHSSWRIRDAMPQAISIDNFIDSHRNDPKIATCGKLAIARCILASESQSQLYFDNRAGNQRINFQRVESTWFNSFFQALLKNEWVKRHVG